MNMGSADDPNYSNTYTPANTHIDLFGLDWYPVWSDNHTTVDVSMIDKYVAAAVNPGFRWISSFRSIRRSEVATGLPKTALIRDVDCRARSG